MKLIWKDLPEEMVFGAEEIATFLGYTEGETLTVTVQRIPKGFSLTRSAEGVVLGYNEMRDFFRAMSLLPRMEREAKIEQTPRIKTLGLMKDMSRNAVMSVAGAKKLMRHLAVAGYNMLMLYTEDTYEIDGHPYIGHMRGKYTKAELKELDCYAAKLGLELIPCIQTLAHMDAVKKLKFYSKYFDRDNIMLAEDDKVYALIEAMLSTCKECFTSRRINIGMDEAHLLGRGAYLDKNGYRPKSEIMLRHLAGVVDLCTKYGFKPMMWSDMFFRMAFDGEYTVAEGEIAQEIIEKVPPQVELVYWNYRCQKKDEAMFRHMLDCHKKFTRNDILFAGGAWSWCSFAPKNEFSLECTEMQLKNCMAYGIDEVIATAWGDDGSECSVFAMLPALLQYAELCYGDSSAAAMNKRAEECYGISFDDLMVLDAAGAQPDTVVPLVTTHPTATEKYMLYSDPFNGLFDRHVDADAHPAVYAAAAQKLAPLCGQKTYGYLYRTQKALCDVLEIKSALSVRITRAYLADDRQTLSVIAAQDIPVLCKRVEIFLDALTEQWLADNKPFGLEVQEQRLGGLLERLASCKERLEQYLAGEVQRIEELEQPTLPRFGPDDDVIRVLPSTSSVSWNNAVSAGRK